MLLIVTVVFFTSVSGFTSAKTPISCQRSSFGDMELNYSLPIRPPCGDFQLSNGSVIIKIPKLIPRPLMKSCQRDNIPAGYRICRRPDCLSGPCVNGWCEETMEAYLCHCPDGFSGKDCSIADQMTTGSAFHASNVTDNRSDTRSTSSISTTQEMTQQSSSIWSSLTSSITYWMSTATTTMTTEMTTMTTEMTKMTTEMTTMTTEMTKMTTATAMMTTETATMTTETATMTTETTSECPPTTTGISDDCHSLIFCQGEWVNIVCPSGEVTSILSANYGRTDRTVCPYKPTSAMEYTSCFLDVASDICQPSGSACNFQVNKDKFGTDPCYGTFKYLNFTYTCIQAELY